MQNEAGLIVATPIKPTRQQQQPLSMEPVTLNQVVNYAEFIAQSELVPKSYRGKPADIVICIQMGNQLGFGAGQSLKSIAVINGTPTLWGDGLLGLCLASPLCLDIQEDNTQTIEANQSASCTVKRRGHLPYTHTYTAKTAKDNGLWKRWTSRNLDPHRMLQLKARNFACRNKFADLLMGMQSAEDTEDFEHQQTQPATPPPLPPDPAALTDAIISEIASAPDADKLHGIGKKALESNLPEDSLERIRDAYRAKRDAFNQPDEGPAPDEPAADN